MPSLFPEDRRPAGKPFRKYPSRPKATSAEPPPLPDGWVLAHCDGGSRGNPGPAGYGAVLVDDTGTPLAELSEFLGMRTNNVAEYSGLLAVLAWALEHGYARVRVISDSELMVRQIEGRYKVNSPDLRPLFEEARRRIGRLEAFEIHHALRHKNKIADQLANDAMDRGMGKAPVSTTPTGGPVGGAVPYQNSPQTSDRVQSSASPGREMLRGFVRDGVIHLLGGKALPENSFVKILPE